jgi:SpoVK/Ycf46/Vps4 family AAA+-type ATPase
MKFLLKTDMNQIIKDEEENTILGFKVVNPEILTRDDFWVRIKRERYQFGILDEMDKILVSRQDETTDSISRDRFVNEFLTYTDGNQKTKTKVIVSTNLDLQQVDKAIIRNGRTFDVLRLKNLTREQALNIWTQYGLEVEEFEKTFKGKTHINPSEIGAKIEFIQNANKANIVAQKYCLEEGVSMISSIIQNNKLSI